MPFADPEDRKTYERQLKYEKYWSQPGFRENEAERKKLWQQANRARIAAQVKAWRARRKAEAMA